jgi:hypothetical protein
MTGGHCPRTFLGSYNFPNARRSSIPQESLYSVLNSLLALGSFGFCAPRRGTVFVLKVWHCWARLMVESGVLHLLHRTSALEMKWLFPKMPLRPRSPWKTCTNNLLRYTCPMTTLESTLRLLGIQQITPWRVCSAFSQSLSRRGDTFLRIAGAVFLRGGEPLAHELLLAHLLPGDKPVLSPVDAPGSSA